MTPTDPPEAIRLAWQASAPDPALPGIDRVRGGADLLYRKVRQRNAIEYGAAVLVVLVFSAYALFLPSPAARFGSVLVVLGTLVMVWQLHRRASALPPPDGEAMQPVLQHQRDQLARQRDALGSVFTWYLLPFLPGLVVMVSSPILDHGVGALKTIGFGYWVSMAMIFSVLLGIWWLNRRAARKLQAMVDEVDALIGEGR